MAFTKTCHICDKEKLMKDFHRRHDSLDGRRNQCKACRKQNSISKGRRKVTSKVRAELNSYSRSELGSWLAEGMKKSPCFDCGGEYPVYVMEFDHCRGEKYKNVSELYVSLAATVREANKCDVVCANCHKVRTHERNQAPKFWSGHNHRATGWRGIG